MPERFAIEWAPVAYRDMDRLIDYIAANDCVEAAIQVHDRILHEIDKLNSFPERCRIPPELRETGIRDFRELVISPYSVFFRIVGRSVAIVGVLDRRRDLDEILLQRLLVP
jgi:plasmid stabilization system protein ParE